MLSVIEICPCLQPKIRSLGQEYTGWAGFWINIQRLVKTLVGGGRPLQQLVELLGTEVVIEEINRIKFLAVLMDLIMAVRPC
jgi:hypothetical protein